MTENPISGDAQNDPPSRARRIFMQRAAASVAGLAIPNIPGIASADRMSPMGEFRTRLATVLETLRQTNTQELFRSAPFEKTAEWIVDNAVAGTEVLLKGTSYDFEHLRRQNVVVQRSVEGVLSVSDIDGGDIGGLIGIVIEGATFGNGVVLENGEILTAGHVAPLAPAKSRAGTQRTLLSNKFDLARISGLTSPASIKKVRTPSGLTNQDVVGQWVAGSFQRIHSVKGRDVIRKNIGGIAMAVTPQISKYLIEHGGEAMKVCAKYLPHSLCMLVPVSQVLDIWDPSLGTKAAPLEGVSGGGMDVQRIMTDPRSQRYEYCGNAWAVGGIVVRNKLYGLLLFHGPDQINEFTQTIASR